VGLYLLDEALGRPLIGIASAPAGVLLGGLVLSLLSIVKLLPGGGVL
jgi:hypothetical protein